jgi:hypothetical protein
MRSEQSVRCAKCYREWKSSELTVLAVPGLGMIPNAQIETVP